MNTFKTLLLREWMQHHKGWLAMMIVPPVLMLAAVAWTPLKAKGMPDMPSAALFASVAATMVIGFMVAWTVIMLQAPGMARRDHQDRSIEFWTSLPVSHVASVGATVLMQLLLVPLLALVAGYVGSVIVGVVAVAVHSGMGGFLQIDWTDFFVGSFETLLYLIFTVTLGMLWLSPLVLMAMAASAWLKRWGVPALVAALGGGHLLLNNGYGISVIGDTLQGLWVNALYSVTQEGHEGRFKGANPQEVFSHWPITVRDLLEGAGMSLSNLAQPLFIFAIATAVAGFALLVLRRSRA
jgi:hypothetical protein